MNTLSLGKKSHFIIFRIKLIICLLFINLSIMSQHTGIYELEICKHGIDYEINLSLYSSNDYCLSIDYWFSDDILDGVYLSYGKYDVKSGKIYLKDTLNGFSMILIIKSKDELFFEKSLCFLTGKTLRYFGINVDQNEVEQIINEKSLSKNKIEKKKEDFLKKKMLIDVYKGKYLSVERQFKLELYENCEYSYFYQPFKISYGTWKKTGNVIELNDSILNHSFYFLIQNDSTLISNFVPGNYWGNTFKLKE